MTGKFGFKARKIANWQLAVAVVALMVASVSSAQDVGNTSAGHELARTWCVSCHLVDSAQASASAAGAPSFAEVATMPTTTTLRLHTFLTVPHPPMLNFQLSNQQVDDVTAYIMSLKQK